MASTDHGSVCNPIIINDEPPAKKVKISEEKEPEFLYMTVIQVNEEDSMLDFDDGKQCYKVPFNCIKCTKGFYMARVDEKAIAYQDNEDCEIAKFARWLLEDFEDGNGGEDYSEFKSDIEVFHGDVPLMEPHTTVIYLYSNY